VRPLLAIVLVAGAGYAAWLVWRDASVAEIPRDLLLLPLGAGFALKLGSFLLSAPIWLGIYRSLGGQVATGEALRIYLLTNVGKYLPGKVLHAAGRVVMLQERGQPAALVVASLMLELVLSVIGAGMVSLASIPVLLRADAVAAPFAELGPLVLLVIPVALVALHPRIMGPVLRLVTRVAPKRAASLGTALPPYRSTLLFVVGNAVLWLLASISLFATAASVHPLGLEWLPVMGGIAAASYLFGLAVPLAPAGLGAREGMMIVLLSTLMPPAAAAVTSVLYRVISIAVELVAAGLALLLVRRTGPATDVVTTQPPVSRPS
jgi:glycosyltransferase 2 family protein